MKLLITATTLLIGTSLTFSNKTAQSQSDVARLRFQNAGQVQTYIDKNGGYPWGRVCAAETGRVYLRGNNLKPAKRTLMNGTHIRFIGTRDDYAWVQVLTTSEHKLLDTPIEYPLPSYRVTPTSEYGYITASYTCGYDH